MRSPLLWTFPLVVACSGGGTGLAGDAGAGTAGAAGSVPGGNGGMGGSAGSAGSGGAAGGGGVAGSGNSAGFGGGEGISCKDASPAMKCCERYPGSVDPFLGHVSWAEANAYCKSHGMSLVKVEDEAKNLAVHAAVKPLNAWLGLSDAKSEGNWEWTDGSPLGAYRPWSYEEPQTGTYAGDAQDCVLLSEAYKTWGDLDCSINNPPMKKRFCCE